MQSKERCGDVRIRHPLARGMKLGWLKTFCLCLFAFFIYLLMIFKIGTHPFSDFQFYYEVALGILRGETISTFYKYFSAPGYPYLLSVILPIYHYSILIPQLLNALMWSGLIWLYLRYPLVPASIATLAGYLLLAFNINCLSMITVLCSEIPYAFFFLVGLYVFGWGFKILFETRPDKLKGRLFYFSVAGFFFGISQSIRPVTFLFLLLISFLVIVGIRYLIFNTNGKGWQLLLKGGMIPLILTWSSFFIVAILLYWASGYGVTYVPQQKGIWNLYVGSNVESKGSWNYGDSELITRLGEKYQWDGIKINKEFLPIVLNRMKADWAKNLQIYPEKLYRLLSPRGIPLWAIEQSKVRDKEKVYKVTNYLSWINGFVLILSLWSWLICLVKKERSWEEFFLFCALGASFVSLIAHGYFLEVQGRYSNHLWLVMFIFYPVSLKVLKQSFIEKDEGCSLG